MSVGSSGKAMLVTLAVLLAGCVVNRPPTRTVFNISGKTYTDLDTMRADLRTQNDQLLQQMTPSAQRLGGTVLVVTPTLARIRAGYPTNLPVQPIALDALAVASDIGYDYTGPMIERSRIFDTVRSIRSDNPTAAGIGDADYKLWVDNVGGTTLSKWILTKRDGKNHEIEIPQPLTLTRPLFVSSLPIGVINAAADMGASVARLPFPAAPGVGPVSGTAFFIDARGHMLTNAHVVESCKNITVSLGDGDTADAKIAAKDSQNDLALLVSTTKIPQYARFAATPPRQGDEVVVYGFPLPGALSTQGNLTTGILSAMVGLRDDSRQFQISAPVQQGNSGGPLFDRNGAVIGIVSSKINALRMAAATGDVPQNVNFAIKANVVTNFLETNGMKFEQAPKGKAMDIADISERARGFTFLIICTR